MGSSVKHFILGVVLGFCFTPLILNAAYTSKARDLVIIEGVKRNVFMGYGLVVGLAGTGDSQNPLTQESLMRYLAFTGVDVHNEELSTRNVAAVAVSATVHGFATKGDVISVQVASIGDARSLAGGLLLTTTLKGPDKKTYIVAEGVLQTAAPNARRATVSSGGTIERSFGTMQDLLGERTSIKLRLKQPSFETMRSLTKGVENKKTLSITALDNKHFILRSLQDNKTIPLKAIADFMKMDVQITPRAKVIIDQKTQVIVLGGGVRIASVFIMLDDLRIQVGDGTGTRSKETQGTVLPANTTVQELADALNLLNIKIEKLIAIFEALRQSGALNAEIVAQ